MNAICSIFFITKIVNNFVLFFRISRPIYRDILKIHNCTLIVILILLRTYLSHTQMYYDFYVNVVYVTYVYLIRLTTRNVNARNIQNFDQYSIFFCSFSLH